MIRLTRQTDLGIQLLTLVAMRESNSNGEPVAVAARELSERSRNPLPSVSKVLKVLAKANLLESHRGPKGGYELARPAEEISVADMVIALEGPIALTECATDDHNCQQMSWCPVGDNMRIINDAIRTALSEVTLAQMAYGKPGTPLSVAVAPEAEER